MKYLAIGYYSDPAPNTTMTEIDPKDIEGMNARDELGFILNSFKGKDFWGLEPKYTVVVLLKNGEDGPVYIGHWA